MYISKMRLENFRCFEGVKELTFNSGVNYFVGNNNCGKTTIFRAIEFLKSAKTKDGWITKGKEDEDVSVEITLEGENLADFLEQDDLKKFQPYLINGSKLIIRKSSELSSWKDGRGKDKEISIKNVSAFNPETRILKILLVSEIQFTCLFAVVWSDINSDDNNNFVKTDNDSKQLLIILPKISENLVSG